METEGGSRDIVRCFGATRTIDRMEEQRQQWREEHLAIPGTGPFVIRLQSPLPEITTRITR